VDANTRRQAATAVLTGIAVFATIICAAEFQDTGAKPMPEPTRTVIVTVSPTSLDPAALRRAREDASRSATPWLAP
jgi:hypothetical protein